MMNSLLSLQLQVSPSHHSETEIHLSRINLLIDYFGWLGCYVLGHPERFCVQWRQFTQTGTGGGTDVNFLNDAFEWDLGYAFCSSANINAANTAGTPWESGSSELQCDDQTDHISCNSEECYPMWGDETSAAVVVLPHGSGQVVYLGFDYYDTGYEVDGFHVDCANRESPWVTSVLRGGLLGIRGLLNCECKCTSEVVPKPKTSQSHAYQLLTVLKYGQYIVFV
eukprot:scaffold37855_cov261-Skeletonema_dohrnii-CCMP3373.AAC.1